jgi:small-conductance mechanosensitive channel
MMEIFTFLFKENNSLTVKILQVALIVILTLLVMRIVGTITRRFERKFINPELDQQTAARYKTFLTTGTYVINIVILFIAILMILLVFDIDITPLLASVGVASLAISLGAQTLIKDYLGGMLILIEDQFRIGDTVTIGSDAGVVEQITLRYISLRDAEGKLIIIPNGEIRVVSKVANDWMRILVDFNIPFEADIGEVVDVLAAAMQKAKADPAIANDLLDDPGVMGWNSFSPWAVQVRMSAKARPGKRLEVASVLRRYGLEALKQAGLQVAIPLPESVSG